MVNSRWHSIHWPEGFCERLIYEDRAIDEILLLTHCGDYFAAACENHQVMPERERAALSFLQEEWRFFRLARDQLELEEEDRRTRIL